MRWVRMVGGVLLGLVALVALVVGGALTYVRTERGGAWLLRTLVPRVNAQIAGRLEAGSLRLRGWRVELRGVTLRTPEGEVVAEAAVVEVAARPLALLRKRLLIERVAVERPALWLVQDTRGLNLQRAVAARIPPKPTIPREHGGSAPSLSVSLDVLAVRAGLVDLQVRRPGDHRHFRVEGIALDGGAAYRAKNAGVSAHLEGSARAERPLSVPIALDLRAEGAGERGEAKLFLSAGGTVLALTLEAHDRKAIDLNIDRLEVEPSLVQALVPGAAGPGAPVALRGHVRRAGSTVTVDLAVRAGAGHLRAEASVDPDDYRLRGLRLTGKSLDLAALLRDGPRSDLDLSVEAQGSGHDLASLRGELKVEVPPGRLGTMRAGPLRVHARAEASGWRLVDLLAELPGLSLRGRGEASRKAVQLEGELVARDLAATRKAVQGRQPLPPLAGSGTLALKVSGPLAGPRLEARGRFPALRFAGDRADQLDVVAAVADLRHPQVADVRLRALRLQLGERRLRDARLGLASLPARRFRASVSVAEPVLGLEAGGQWRERFDGLTVDELRLSYPEARWQLVRPARLTFAPAFTVDDLALAAGPQRIAVSLRAGERLAAKVNVAQLDLGRLPRALLPASLVLGGQLDLDAELAGTMDRPRGRASLALSRGRYQKLDSLDVKLEARDDGRRLAGTLDGKSSQAAVSARFDLPATWPPPERAPVSLALTVAPFDIPALLASVGAPARGLRGRASLKATIDGTFARPQATVDARVERMAVRGKNVGDATLALAVTSPVEGTEVQVRLDAFGGRASARARAPLTIARLAHLQGPALLRTPVTIEASADQLPLGPLAALAGSDLVNAGTLTLRLEGHGPARAPAATLKLRLEGAAGRRFPATDALVELAVREQEGSQVTAQVSRRGQTLGTLDATVHLPSARLTQLPALASAPLTVRAHVGPLRVQRQALPAATERDKEGTLTALLEAGLRLEGTLRDPRVELTASTADARLDGRPLGKADLELRYRDAQPRLAINITTASGGELHLTGSTELDLGYPRVLRPTDWKTLPITADLESRELDLAVFSGLVRPVRTVAGRLSANARLRGNVGAPQVAGRLEWKDGRLVVADLGGYEGVHLLVHGDGNSMVLEDLSARAGSGHARVTAKATRAAPGKFTVETTAKLDKFPLYSEGQPLAALSLDARAHGNVAADRIGLTAKVDEAHVALAEGKRKRLQPLARPRDIVLLDEGKPLNREQAKKLRRLAVERQSEETAQEAETAPSVQPRRVKIAIEAPRNLWVEGPDVHLELGLGEGFVVTMADETRVFGTVLVKRGRASVLGKRFDLDPESTVRFTGPPDRPTLAVKATYEARKAGVSVRVSVDGPSDKLDLKLSSPEYPQLGDTELLALVATGHLPGDRTAGGTATPGTQAMSVLGGVVAAQLQKGLAKKLPLDVLVIEPGEGLNSTRLEAGTYLTDSLYAAWVGRLGADPFGRENRNEVQLEYQLSRRWSVQGIYGDMRRGSADIVWTKNY
jgi:translocation and assembly module TamB